MTARVEFYAHTGNVNCAILGKKQTSIFATGSDDGKINIWKYMKPQYIISFPGHSTSEVSSLCFDYKEELIFSGSRGGSIKQWDLTTQKGVRAFPNTHRCSVDTLKPHPMNGLFASGSSDTFIKLWDASKKDSIFTYKGHQAPITTIAFSPDGSLLCSGDESGAAKMFDLRTGRCLQTMNTGDQPITSIQFHPSDLVVAIGGGNRCVEIWDLNNERYSVIETTDLESTKIRALTFQDCDKYPEDDSDIVSATCRQAVIVATQDTLKTWSWEPKNLLDSVDMKWGNVSDMTINSENQLLAISFQNSTVCNWIVELDRVQPYAGYVNRREHRMPALPRVSSSGTPIKFNSSASADELANLCKDFSNVMSPAWKAEVVNKVQQAQSHQDQLPKPVMPIQAASEIDSRSGLTPLDTEIKNEIISSSSTFQQILNIRLNRIRTLKSVWVTGKYEEFFNQLVSLNDPSVTFDIITVCLPQIKKILTLDLAIVILPLSMQLFSHKHHDSLLEHYVLLGIQITQLVVEGFAETIASTILSANNNSNAVDVAREMRFSKCLSCVSEFRSMKLIIENLILLPAPIGVNARVLNSLLTKLYNL